MSVITTIVLSVLCAVCIASLVYLIYRGRIRSSTPSQSSHSIRTPHTTGPNVKHTLSKSEWFGYNVMPGGYDIKCLQALIDNDGFLSIRNNLSSYITPGSSAYWEKSLREFLDANVSKVALYTCLQWQNKSDLVGLTKMSYLTHVQVNQGTYTGNPPPRTVNPTEDRMCGLKGFDRVEYVNWIKQIHDTLQKDVVIVLPFKWGRTGKIDDCFNSILKDCALIQAKSGRAFGLEATMYLFWDGYTIPDKANIEKDIDQWMQTVESYRKASNLSRLDFIVSESGWPAHVADTCQTLAKKAASLSNAIEYYNNVLQYTPKDPNFRLYYWQFQDVDNGDQCGKTWGVFTKDCEVLGT